MMSLIKIRGIKYHESLWQAIKDSLKKIHTRKKKEIHLIEKYFH